MCARGVPWDDRGQLEEAQTGLEVLAAALAAVLPRGDMDLRGEGPSSSGTGLFLRFLDQGGEGGERWLPVDRCSVASEPDLVEGAFSQPSQPAMERGEVGLVGTSFGARHRATVSPETFEVRLRELLDDGDRVRLSGKQVRWQGAAARAAIVALGERDLAAPPVFLQRDGLAPNASAGQLDGPRPALCAADIGKEGLDPPATLVVDVFFEVDKVYGQHVRQRA